MRRPPSSRSGTRETARERSALFDLIADEAVLQPADRSAPPDRVLRRPPPGVQLQHAREARSEVRASIPSSKRLFARGIDPSEEEAGRSGRQEWPSRAAVRQFAEEADRRVREALSRTDLDRPGDPLLHRSEAVFAILEHEAMHQETLLYMFHRLPAESEAAAASVYGPWSTARCSCRGMDPDSQPASRRLARMNRRCRFGWDNERPHCLRRRCRFFTAAARRHERRLSRVREPARTSRRRSGRSTATTGTGAGCSI